MLFGLIKSRGETKGEAKSASLEDVLRQIGTGNATAAGIAVSPHRALKNSTAYACLKILSESVAQLPLHLYKREGDGKTRATEHPLYALLNEAPNPWTSSLEFRAEMMRDALLHGSAFAFINRDRAGTILELIQIDASLVEVLTDPLTMEPSYRVANDDGSKRDYAREDIFHIRALGGLSPVWQCREAIGLALAIEEHTARIFSNGARPSGVLQYPKVLGADAIKRLRESFNASHQGGSNSGKVLVLEDGMTFEPQQFSSVDLQLLELRRHQVGDIARAFRIPLHMVGELERATHNNAESMGRQFLSLTLLPWLRMWEQAIRRSLLADDERSNFFAEFLTDDLARADFAARFDAYAKAVTNGLLTPNEIRAAENRSPLPGGDDLRFPLNTAVDVSQQEGGDQ